MKIVVYTVGVIWYGKRDERHRRVVLLGIG